MKERRLDQWLSQLGYCSRQEARSFLKKHNVCNQGKRLLDPSKKLAPEFTIDDEALDHPLGFVLLMNKPKGYVCSQSEAEGARVFDLLPLRWQNRQMSLQTVGRLDKDTTGTLLITDQGQWIHQWSHPKVHFKKKYIVRFEGELDSNAEKVWKSGNWVLPGETDPCLSAHLERLDKQTAALTLQEGKYHQVKRMFLAMGAKVIELHRESFGPWNAEHLAPGEWETLAFSQVQLDLTKYKDFIK